MNVRMSRSKVFVVLIKLILCTIYILPLINCLPQDTTTVKPGRYVPELYGAHLGKYVPDDSGKYYHIHRPYDGGYGDRGIQYVHDASGNLVPLSTRPLGPKDHLRFMIDFNYDNSGWEIINFEWLRDGDDNYNYKYVNENQLFPGNDANGDAAEETSGNSEQNNNNESGVHIDGEYNENNGYNYLFNNGGSNTNSKNLQQAIREVIYYIEHKIIPTL